MTYVRKDWHTMYSLIVLIALAGLLFYKNALAVAPGRTVVWEGGGAGRVVFDGTVHKNKGFKCHDCHTRVFANMEPASPPTRMSMKDMYAGKLCGACHNGKDAFSVSVKTNCTRCHKKQ